MSTTQTCPRLSMPPSVSIFSPLTPFYSQELLASARNQALHRVRYRSPIPADREIEDIGEVAQRIVSFNGRSPIMLLTERRHVQSDKEEELQRLADQSAALTLACAQALQVVCTAPL